MGKETKLAELYTRLMAMHGHGHGFTKQRPRAM